MIYDVKNLLDGLGGIEKTKEALAYFREQTKGAGFPDLHLQITIWGENSLNLSGFDSNMSTAKGEVWYLEGGNIVLGVMSTGVNEAIQYQFFHPEVSSDKPADNQGNSNSVLEKIFQ